MKFNILLFIVFLAIVMYAGVQIPTGVVGKTEKNGAGCTCHNPQRDFSVNVQIDGPDTLFKGETATYQLTLSGGPAVAGGFNVASHRGLLNPLDGTSQSMAGELTHTSPKLFSGSSVVWEFSLTALDSVYTDTIYSASNSVNNDGNASSQDRWNFGDKFVIHVIEQPTSVSFENQSVTSFKLEQNFPNPFNPTTNIEFSLTEKSDVSLIVYNSLGEKISELVNGNMESGHHNVIFDAAELPSGLYIYQMVTKGNNKSFVQSRKMILIK